jgi:hypothetical protein
MADRANQVTDPRVLNVELGIGALNKDIIERMRVMKSGRETRRYGNVVCTFSGVTDPREMYANRRARALCTKLVQLGFVSYLNYTTTFLPDLPGFVRQGWGMLEIWLCSLNIFDEETPVTIELLDESKQVLKEANTRARALLGPCRRCRA